MQSPTALPQQRGTWHRVFEKEAANAGGSLPDGRKLLQAYLKEKESSTLKAWFKYFDRNMNGMVSFFEFRDAIARAKFPCGNAQGLWMELDPEESGEITLEEICSEQAALWNNFRKWCGCTFEGARDMIAQLKQAAQPLMPKRASGELAWQLKPAPDEQSLTPLEWFNGLQQCAWSMGSEELLFDALDISDEGTVVVRDLQWLEAEVHRRKQKEGMKRMANRESLRRAASRQLGQAMLRDFKAFIRHGFGPTYHAWRRVLDSDGSMMLPRAELFKVCRQLNWKGDVRALWRALDFDGSGATTIEELDPQCAQLLAHLKDWAEHTWGPKPSAAMWKDLDRRRKRKLTYPQFVQECQARGFERKLKTLAVWLDWRCKKYIEEDDLRFLDAWRPAPWLVAQPNPEAAEQFKRHLKQRYGHYLRAWRVVMDKDGSNCCNWHEFVDAAKQAKYHGDVAGAWLSLDDDLSGFVSLKEIDAATHDSLVVFKQWATDEFGSVASAFKVLDKDHSRELTFKEFRFAVRNYGFMGDLKALFETLDQDKTGHLQLKEMVFLDRWDTCEDLEDRRCHEGDEAEHGLDAAQEQVQERTLAEYSTLGPGPGAYDVHSGFGAAPWTPTARHGGAFSFGGRSKTGWLRVARSVGPAHYDLDPKVAATQQKRKPAWSFGSQVRAATTTPREEKAPSPGPGAYEANNSFQGPKFSMGNRRGMMLHPLQRAYLTPGQRPDRSQSYR